MSSARRDWRDDLEDERYEARMEARREAAAEEFDAVAVTCGDCGYRWDPGLIPASRIDPAWELTPECPDCGGEREEER